MTLPLPLLGYVPIGVRPAATYPRVRLPAPGAAVQLPRPAAGGGLPLPAPVAALAAWLRHALAGGGAVEVATNWRLPTANPARPYAPALVLHRPGAGLNLYLALEIDAPYDEEFRQPTHCLGADDARDAYFTQRGWGVVRLAEEQVCRQPRACVALLAHLLARLDPTYQPPPGLPAAGPADVPAWSALRAQQWEKENYRATYPPPELPPAGAVGRAAETTEAEAGPDPATTTTTTAAASAATATTTAATWAALEAAVGARYPLPAPLPPGPLALAHPDPRAPALRFDPAAHQYYLHGQPATSVSSLYKRFFPEFDTERWAAEAARKRGVPAEEVRQEWAARGAGSAGAGTALHQQIEAVYNGAPPIADDAPEFAHFRAFFHDHPHLVPFRTEWPIYDEALLLAGTVDLVARQPDGSLAIYDWKRSKKVVGADGQPLGNHYRPAEGPLRDLPDCAFSRYSLQLNIYQWLLETHYGYRVSARYLVVLHPDYDRYHLVPVPAYPRHLAQLLAARRAELAPGS